MTVNAGGLFGAYESQSTRQLAQISSSKFPDTNKDFEANLRRLNAFVDYIAQYLKVMQKGLDKANVDTLTRMRDMAADFTVLLGGGELLYGINLGDLQYFLPALGALFGIDANVPFPINLFNMAQRFFLGYVVPLDSFVLTIQDLIDGWLVALGVSQEFIDTFNAVMTELAGLGSTFLQIITDLWDLLDIFGVSTNGFGPFADIWHVVTKLLGGFSLQTLGTLLDPVFDALAPWMKVLHQFVALLNVFFGVFNIDTNNINGPSDFFGPLAPVFDIILPLFENISTEVIAAFRPVWDIILGWSTPFAELLSAVMTAIGDAVSTPGGLIDMLDQLVQLFFDEGTGIISTILTAIAGWTEPFIQLLNSLVDAFTGIAGGPGPFVELLKAVSAIFAEINTVAFKPVIEAIAQWSAPFVALIVQLVEAFTAILNSVMGSGNFNQLLNMFTDIFKILNLFNTAGFGSGLLSPSSWINGISGFANNVLNPSNWAQSLLGFGNANSGMSMIGSGQIQDAPQNLLMNGIFNSFNAFVPMNGWTVDPVNTVGNAVGSALVSLTNGVQSMVSNAIKVVTGDVLNFSTQAQWNGVAGPGLLSAPPIGMSVNLYADSGAPGIPGAFISSTPLATVGGTPGSAPTVTSGPPSAPSSWVPLTAAFTVPSPNSPAPAYAALVYHASHEINAGEVRFTDADLSKTSTMPQSAVRNLPEDKQAIIDKTAGTTGATLADIEARLAGIAALTGHLDWNYAPDMRTINDAIVNNLNGWAGSQWDHPDAAAAIMGQKSTTVAANTSINTLKTAIAGIKADIAALAPPARTDVFWSDEFVRTNASSIGTGWTVTASGAGTQLLGTDGQRVVPNSLTQQASRYFHARWNGAQTTSNTDYQTITQVLGTAATEASGGAKGYNDTLGRVNGTTDYVRFRVIAGRPPTWSLDYISAGVAYNIIGGQLEWYPSTKKLVCGNRDVPTSNILSVYVDQQLIWTGADTNHHIGASYRGMGFGYGIQYVSGNEPAIGGFPDSWTGIDTQLG